MRTRGGRLRSRGLVLLGSALTLALAAGCTNTPPPPLVSSPTSATSSTPPAPARQITVGVSSVAGGYNPHNLADQSTITTALSQLLLPSVFRPGPNGAPALDSTLMRSAEVTKADPFTVTYQLRGDASWSDSVPIAAEDFVYLWQQMRSSPGVIDPSGYQLISNITSRQAGKEVEVTFSEPYPGWRTLFSNLLPAHLLKDAPGGWSGALGDTFPAYGGPFAIKTKDAARGEILLERNERYWERPAEVDQLVLRRSDQAGISDALRSGNDQVALVRTDAAGRRELARLNGGIESHDVPQPTVAGLVLRPVGPVLSDERVRSGLAAMLNRDALIAAGASGGPGAELRADSQVLAPSSRGYRQTMPRDAPAAEHDEARAERLLAEAGYRRTAEGWVDSDDQPLRLVLAAPADVEPYVSIAEELRRQLVAGGVQVRLRTPEPRELYGGLLNTPSQPIAEQDDEQNVGANIVVGPQPAGGDPATLLADKFGCRSLPAPGDGTSGARPPANSAGFCDPALQPSITAALTGRLPLDEVLPRVEPQIWRQSVAIPLFQLADTLAVRPDVSEVDSGPPMAGPFQGAIEWRRSAR
ncbi:MAG: ABC transporter family substrate-binding protein [Pseudonocardiaceae bacterium]|nr:ABC transporter family substrate-binding protein [Pseudonocardiaceae bacterium]